jgi:RHS repeat-associated protein
LYAYYGYIGTMTTTRVNTGNYYYGARYYDPKVSVWLSVDPLAVLAPNLTPYRFSFNNPVNVVDPNGLFEDPKDAQKAQNKAQKKLGEDRVGDVYYDPDKEEYGYRVYDEGQDKHTRGSSGNGEATVTAYKGQGVYDNKGWNQYKSANGLYTPYVASGSVSFLFGGGASYTYGLVQDKYGNQRTFSTLGGGVGFESGAAINYGLIKEKEGFDFHVEDFEGLGFEYGGGIGPFSIKNAGNTGRHGFELSGRDYEVIQGSGSPEGVGAILKALSKAKFRVGGSYQWNKTTLH